jgi:Metallo-beta-lactamase superfamily
MAPATKPSKPSAKRTAAHDKVRIRMYRQGLGDCFLLRFPGKDGTNFNLLIDCGVVLGTDEKGVKKLHDAVADIVEITDNHIDLLVVTHEHWDHVSGFKQARDLFEQLGVDQVWVAWTEDPNDKLAAKLRAERRSAENAVRMAATRLALADNREAGDRINSLLGFLGATAGSTEEAFTFAKGLSKRRPRYCQPGEAPIVLPQLPGIRFWVLGPPKDEKLIKKSDPGKTAGYGLDAGPDGLQAPLLSALVRDIGFGADNLQQESDFISDQPFEDRFEIPTARAMQIPFFERRYFGESTDESLWLENRHELRDQSWRRIDGDWLDTSETLALALDSATNNTSLVLGVEIIATGDILLFPGDAQAGNWLSWQDLSWQVKNSANGEKETVTGPDLLARTLFYKVGHHGSHNATLREKGLELMTHPNLQAMIPVDHDMAVKKRWGRMPLPDLVARLEEKTAGRLLRIDDKWTSNADLKKAKPDKSSLQEWKEFSDRVAVDPLYFELSL